MKIKILNKWKIRKELKEERILKRKGQYHDDPYHPSNWCAKCGLYYCWHPECEVYRKDPLGRSNHKFVPNP